MTGKAGSLGNKIGTKRVGYFGDGVSCPLILTRLDNQIHADVTTNLFVALSNDNYFTKSN